jgi:hypothetical protein
VTASPPSSPARLVRMPQEVIDLLKARAEEEFGPVATAGGARAGGASKLVRRLVYEFLGVAVDDNCPRS